jgi:thiol-disulfide isomerase/thioredoxin
VKATRALATSAGVAFLAVIALGAVQDVRATVRGWSEMGPLGPDDAMPDFGVELASGGELSRDDLEGRPSVLTFWATWCGACRDEMPAIESIRQEYGERVAVVGVNRDRDQQKSRVLSFRDQNKLSFEMALDDGSMARAFRVSLIPHVVVLDHHARVRHVHQGRVGSDVLAEELDELLEEAAGAESAR